MNFRRLSVNGLLIVIALMFSANASFSEPQKTWKPLIDLSPQELELYDPSQNTPRDASIPYIPAEKYPFSAPYTAEEMGYRYAEFPHINRWANTMNDVFGVVTPSGYINQGAWITYTSLEGEPGFEGYMRHKPGEIYAKWMIWQTFPPDGQGGQQFWTPYRSDKNFRTKLDFYIYSKGLRRIRRMPEPRRDQRFPDNAQTIDDVMGRDPWEFKWEVLGTDVLYETVRFPNTRPKMVLNLDGKGFTEKPTESLKMMGENFEHYRSDGGVDCWVLKATADPDWVPDGYAEKYLVIWLEKNTFYPLRTEKYGLDDRLIMVDDRLARFENPARKELGYSAYLSVYWNLDHDLISYSFHDGLKPREWTKEEKKSIFTAEFMRREWMYEMVKTQALVEKPDQFFLRSKLYPNKFPEHRNVTLSAEIQKRYQAQEAAGKLIFESAGNE